jgi:hypothetical protein
VRTLSHPLAYLIVILAAAGAVLFVRTAVEWSRWIAASAGAAGVAGLLLAAGATANLAVPRTCASDDLGDGQVLKEVNRPVVSLVLGGDACYADALGQTEILGVIVVVMSAVAVKRTARAGSGPSPGAPPG